ncbi:hypothetical protein STEG23_000753 [Scotinomys teguina]
MSFLSSDLSKATQVRRSGNQSLHEGEGSMREREWRLGGMAVDNDAYPSTVGGLQQGLTEILVQHYNDEPFTSFRLWSFTSQPLQFNLGISRGDCCLLLGIARGYVRNEALPCGSDCPDITAVNICKHLQGDLTVTDSISQVFLSFRLCAVSGVSLFSVFPFHSDTVPVKPAPGSVYYYSRKSRHLELSLNWYVYAPSGSQCAKGDPFFIRKSIDCKDFALENVILG